jgi:hypothetical protein
MTDTTALETYMEKHAEAWQLVVDFLHYEGKHRDLLNELQQAKVRLEGNGFGDLKGAQLATDLLWDWSHVRDSDDRHVFAMAAKIRDLYPVETLK